MISIRATDHDVTVWSEAGIINQYQFGLTGSELAELLEDLGIEVTYLYDQSTVPSQEARTA